MWLNLYIYIYIYIYIINQSILFRNNNKHTLYMYTSNQNKKVLLRGGHMAHKVPSSCDQRHRLLYQTVNLYISGSQTGL